MRFNILTIKLCLEKDKLGDNEMFQVSKIDIF